MTDVPDRVRQILLDYADEGDPTSIALLGQDVRKPALTWFPAEFERLLRAGAFTTGWWGRVLYRDDWTDEETPELHRDLREIWTAVAPGKPYPSHD